jgi:protein-S-isoprenylcysteine O-methyltransferase Ste14
MGNNGPVPPGTWTRRRRLAYLVLAYCAVMVPAMTFWSPDSVLVGQTVIALVGLAASTLASYIFGATWDDKNARNAER